MSDLIWVAAGIALLAIAWTLAQRQKDAALLRRIDADRDKPEAVARAMDEATAAEKAREEAWRRQNPGR